MTKPTLVITRVRMLHFTRQYKDTLQRRLMILMSFCFKFLGYMCTNNYSNKERFDEVIAKIKWCSYFASQCTSRLGRGSWASSWYSIWQTGVRLLKVVGRKDSQPFRSRANSLPGANRPIGPWPIRSLELSHSRVFAPRNIRSLKLSFPVST